MEKLAFAAASLLLLIAVESRQWKRRKRKTNVWICVLTAPALYLGTVYIWHPQWPTYSALLEQLYGGPSDRLVKWLGSIG